MKISYIAKIQANIKRYKTIKSSKLTTSLLDGSYLSVFKGRSMNFDELREYVPGDDIKDIDWKASAKNEKLFVRQYIAEKKHNFLLIFDSNARMLASANDKEEKRDVALLTGGTLGYLVSQNADFVSAIYGLPDDSEKKIVTHPFKSGLANLENILDGYHSAVKLNNHSSVNDSIDYALKNVGRRMIILIVTDLKGVDELSENLIKRLMVLHDVLLVTVGEESPRGIGNFDVLEDEYIPDFFSTDKLLEELDTKEREEAFKRCEQKLKKCGVSYIDVKCIDDIDNKIIELMSKKR